MAGLNVSLLTGKNSLLMRQEQMNLIGNNVANAGRAEYHRQTAEIVANNPVRTSYGQVGTGARIDDILRSYDIGLEISYREALSQEGYDQAYLDRLELIEDVMAPDGDSALTEAVADFADAWQNLANRPEAVEERSAVLHFGDNLAKEINFERARLVSLQDSIASSSANSAAASKIAELNSLGERMATMNREIFELEQRAFLPSEANDLRDQRDALVADMAELADVTWSEQADGSYNVAVGGRDLVTGASADAIDMTMVGNTPTLTWASDGAAVTLTTGQVKGLLDARVEVVNHIAALDAFTAELTTAVNTAHTGGFDIAGNAGTDFFDNTTPGAFAVLITDPDLVAAGNVANHAGDGNNALDVWNALNTPVVALGNDTIAGHVDRVINDLSRDIASGRIIAEGSAAGVQMYREAIGRHSGVNVEEEMLDMLEVQRAYQASAKFIGVVDEMLGNVINMV